MAGAGFAARRAWPNPLLRRLVPAGLVTVFGMLLLVGFYRWGFDQGSCSSRGDVVCLTNANQGVLTLLAIGLAALAVWVEVVARLADERRAERAKVERADRAVAAAIEECAHNLLHIALCYEGTRMAHLPWGMAIDDTLALANPEVRPFVADGVIERIDRIRRTFETLQEMRAAVQNARTHKDREEAERTLRNEPPDLQGFVVQHMGLLVEAWGSYSANRSCDDVLRQPGLQDLPRIHSQYVARRARYQYFRTSEKDAQEEAAKIRTSECPILCWFDDRPIGVPTFAMGPRFADAARAHVH
jgi:hypothetical protein